MVQATAASLNVYGYQPATSADPAVPLRNWPYWDHDALPFPQYSNYQFQSDAPSRRVREPMSGPERPEMIRKVSNQVWQMTWLFTNAQFLTFSRFHEGPLKSGQNPFQMRVINAEAEDWRMCRFMGEYTASPVSSKDWRVSANILVGYVPDWSYTWEDSGAPGPTQGPESMPLTIPTSPNIPYRFPGTLSFEPWLDTYESVVSPLPTNDTRSSLATPETDLIYSITP